MIVLFYWVGTKKVLRILRLSGDNSSLPELFEMLRKGNLHGQPNSLTPVAFENSSFYTSHNDTPIKDLL